MSTTKLGIFLLIVLAGIAMAVALQHHAQVGLREENESLRQEVSQLPRLTSDNRRLSNLVTQAKGAQTSANEQFQELLKLRAEVIRLDREKQDSNRLDQAKLSQAATDQVRELAELKTDVRSLTDEIGLLRDEIAQLHDLASTVPGTTTTATTPDERPATQTANNAVEQRNMALRVIDTHPEAFAEKLKRSVGAQDNESFQEVYARFLQSKGVDTSTLVGAVFDERTGRIFVRGPQPTLDLVERVTTALDRSP
jgi:predicted  nucleic acid-binding Zn-ribbon protein